MTPCMRALKARAAAEGRSMNALVVDALEAAAAAPTGRAEVRARIRAAGLLVAPPNLPGRVTVGAPWR